MSLRGKSADMIPSRPPVRDREQAIVFLLRNAPYGVVFRRKWAEWIVDALLPQGQKVTHGRHCTCSACAAEDWTNADLAPCGMHGSDCPALYQPWGAAGTYYVDPALLPQPDPEGGDAHERNAAHTDGGRDDQTLPADVAQAGDGGESVPGQPDPEVERGRQWTLRGPEHQEENEDTCGWDYPASVKGDLGDREEVVVVPLADLERAEECLRAVTEAAGDVADAEAFYPNGLPAAIARLRAVLSSHPEPPEPCPWCNCPPDQYDGHACDEFEPTWRGRAGRAEDSLREAIRVIEGLADQQAMEDLWFEAPLARLRSALPEAE